MRKLTGDPFAGQRTNPVSVRMPEELYEFLKLQSEEAGVSLSTAINQIVAMWREGIEANEASQSKPKKK